MIIFKSSELFLGVCLNCVHAGFIDSISVSLSDVV